MNPYHALVVFAVVAVTDVVWANYTMAVAAQRRFRATITAGLIIATGIVSIDAYIESRWYVVPAILGAMVGTFFAVGKAKVPELPAVTPRGPRTHEQIQEHLRQLGAYEGPFTRGEWGD